MPKKYIIIDGEAMGFMEWTFDEPMTRSQVITKFHEFSNDDGMDYKRSDFNFEMIQEIWNVRIRPVDVPIVKCPECACPMRRDCCPNCGKIWTITI